ncbi:MAG: response regulator transcription factor [Firmicutes bacterium]|nr:response regulator transcription factor [Bacillota bacterium]
MEKSTTILLIEDDEDIREGVRILLDSEGYRVAEAATGAEGLSCLNDQVELILLDIMLPDISGLKVCEEIRKTSVVPILFLTARAMESDKLIGLMAGGDDYLTKPFSYAELLGRVKALLRRYREYNEHGAKATEEENPYLELSGIRIHTSINEVYVNGREVSLTELEYQILRLLMQHPKKIFSAQNLYESIWDEPYFYNCNGTVVVHIRKLRVKLETDPRNPQYIRTVWGKGYRFGTA